MASMGLGPDARALRAREDELFETSLEQSKGQEGASQLDLEAEAPRAPARSSETEDEAAQLFAEAMGSLWSGEGPTSAPPDEIEQVVEPTTPEPQKKSWSDGESDAEAGRIFEDALKDLVLTPDKEEDLALQPVARDPWSESTEILKRMVRKGRLRHDSELDLHGMTQREAKEAVASYLANSATMGSRLVRIVCGRGLHSRAGSVLLRDTLPSWLAADFSQWVERSFRAPREQGGEGAWYAVLRSL
jgi:DNA-nicking Smr family endonuclease